MLLMRAVISFDLKMVSSSATTTNLSNVPGWIQGSTLDVGKWSIDIEHTQGTQTFTDLDYPIIIHHDFVTPIYVSKIKAYRMIGTNELYIQMTPGITECTILDLKIEFVEQADQ